MEDFSAPLPSYIQIEPVGQCNLRCQMCPILYRQDGPPWGPPAFMKFETYTSIIDQFTGLRDLHLQGLGEPMKHPKFMESLFVQHLAHDFSESSLPAHSSAWYSGT
jgi:hypothetical protein